MLAGQIALIRDVHLHRLLLLMRAQQRRLTHAILEALVIHALVRVFQKRAVDLAFSLVHFKRLLGAKRIERTPMRTRFRYVEILAITRCRQHARRISTYRHRLAFLEANIDRIIEVARHLRHAAQICGDLAVIFLAFLKAIRFNGAHRA